MRGHGLIQAEGFRLVLLQRIALATAAQADHLTQMIEHDRGFAAEVIYRKLRPRLRARSSHETVSSCGMRPTPVTGFVAGAATRLARRLTTIAMAQTT